MPSSLCARSSGLKRSASRRAAGARPPRRPSFGPKEPCSLSLPWAQADNLKTNYRGVYVLHDARFRCLLRLPASAPADAVARQLLLPAGMLRGALAALGVAATVAAEPAALPACAHQSLRQASRFRPTAAPLRRSGRRGMPSEGLGLCAPLLPAPIISHYFRRLLHSENKEHMSGRALWCGSALDSATTGVVHSPWLTLQKCGCSQFLRCVCAL